MNSDPAYEAFLKSKDYRIEVDGFEPRSLSPKLYPFQADIVRWALRQGRSAIFADCGLGKSFMQIEWARVISEEADHNENWQNARVLIVAPIAVGQQTIDEAAKLGVTVTRVSEPSDAPGIQITNYERLHLFREATHRYTGIVLDESSILKSLDGKTRTLLIKEFSQIPYRLCCTATPAPNDVSELANHAEFLGAMSRVEMLATFFVHDSDDGEWRLKGHAAADMWRWMAQWAVFVRRPSDLGYPDGDWHLPPLSIADEVVATGLDPAQLGGIQKRSAMRRATLSARVDRAAEIIRSTPGQWLVWCGLNDEGRELFEALGGEATLIEGDDTEQVRIDEERAWREGTLRVMISKPAIFGFGMNWQHCSQVMFLGLGDSYEQYYQAIRRCWRFGQSKPVDVRIVISDAEGAIAANVKRKEEEAAKIAESIVAAVRETQAGAVRTEREDKYETRTVEADNWALMLGDSIERIKEIPDGSVAFEVFSPPFASLYTYSASSRDLGNCRTREQFFEHFNYLIPELKRVLMPGRRCAVHCQQIALKKGADGWIGLVDFRGDLIRAFQAAGFIYDGEICIDKNPQAQAIRTKSKQLMFVQKNKDSSWVRPALADYVLLFRHPDEGAPVPVKTDVTNEEWILFAHPVWYGIRESDVLKYREAREDEDEKHICPLQLETIERCVRLYSNPGEVVLSPFAGIGSEGYVSRRFGRSFIGIELKKSYFEQAVKQSSTSTSASPRE
jgi:DNA modification methylase